MNWEVRTMRSKTSCFNSTLFKKNLSRYWPLWGLASFGGAMFPLAMLLELLHNGFRFWSPLETRQAYYTVLSLQQWRKARMLRGEILWQKK